MLYWYSQRHVHEVFIFITIRRKEATSMIIIARSPGNRSLRKLRYHIGTTVQHRTAREEPRKPDAYVLPSSPRDYEDVCFLFLILDAKIAKSTFVKFEQKLTSSYGTEDVNVYKTGHFKTI